MAILNMVTNGGGGGSDISLVDVMIVGGGGGGGHASGYTPGGGGGAGGFLKICRYALTSKSTNVAVGAGGYGGSTYMDFNCPGCPSYFGNLCVCGGGRGIGGTCSCNCCGGMDGGSGGGGWSLGASLVNGGCSLVNDTPMGCIMGGNNGGNGVCLASDSYRRGAGGGGAGGAGCSATSYTCGGDGGIGVCNDFAGVTRCYAGGGGGAGRCCPGLGKYGGGNGGICCNDCPGCNATTYGSGGGGAGQRCCYMRHQAGGRGCQGIVVVRYPTDGSYGITSATGGNTCRTCTIGGVEYKIHEFTSNGTFNIVS